MRNHRTSRSVGNFATGWVLQALTMGISLFSTPLLLRWLGDERYGAFRAASDWVGYVGLLELGVGGSLLALLARAVGQGDRAKVRLTLATGIRVYLQIMAVMALAGVVLGFFITHLVQVKGTLGSELQIGYWVGLMGILLLPLFPFQLLADASQRSYLKNAFLLAQSFLITFLSLLLAWAGIGIPGQYLAVLLGGILFQFSMSWDGLRRYPDVFAAVADRHSQLQIEKKLWQLNLPTLLLNLSGQLSVLSDNIVISYFLGSVMVVPFVLTQRLAMLAQKQIQGIGNSTWAALVELYAKGEHQTFNTRLIELTQLVAVLGLAFMVPIAAYNPYFIQLWVGSARFGGEGVGLLAASNGFSMGIFSLWVWCFTGTGNVARVVPLAIVWTAVNLVVSLVSTSLFGLIGPLLGSFVAYTTVSLWWSPVLLRQIFGTSLRQLFWAVAKPLGVGIPYAVGVWWFARSHTPWGWFGLASEMALTALLYLALAWLLVFNAVERAAWLSRRRILLLKTKE